MGLLLALLFATAAFTISRTDAWGFGERIVHSISCALQGGCAERASLDLAYGDEIAALVRRYSPNIAYERSSAALPIDFRRCRKTDCSDGSDAARQIAVEIVRGKYKNHGDPFFAKLQMGAARDYGPPADLVRQVEQVLDAMARLGEKA